MKPISNAPTQLAMNRPSDAGCERTTTVGLDVASLADVEGTEPVVQNKKRKKEHNQLKPSPVRPKARGAWTRFAWAKEGIESLNFAGKHKLPRHMEEAKRWVANGQADKLASALSAATNAYSRIRDNHFARRVLADITILRGLLPPGYLHHLFPLEGDSEEATSSAKTLPSAPIAKDEAKSNAVSADDSTRSYSRDSRMGLDSLWLKVELDRQDFEQLATMPDSELQYAVYSLALAKMGYPPVAVDEVASVGLADLRQDEHTLSVVGLRSWFDAAMAPNASPATRSFAIPAIVRQLAYREELRVNAGEDPNARRAAVQAFETHFGARIFALKREAILEELDAKYCPQFAEAPSLIAKSFVALRKNDEIKAALDALYASVAFDMRSSDDASSLSNQAADCVDDFVRDVLADSGLSEHAIQEIVSLCIGGANGSARLVASGSGLAQFLVIDPWLDGSGASSLNVLPSRIGGLVGALRAAGVDTRDLEMRIAAYREERKRFWAAAVSLQTTELAALDAALADKVRLGLRLSPSDIPSISRAIGESVPGGILQGGAAVATGGMSVGGQLLLLGSLNASLSFGETHATTNDVWLATQSAGWSVAQTAATRITGSLPIGTREASDLAVGYLSAKLQGQTEEEAFASMIAQGLLGGGLAAGRSAAHASFDVVSRSVQLAAGEHISRSVSALATGAPAPVIVRAPPRIELAAPPPPPLLMLQEGAPMSVVDADGVRRAVRVQARTTPDGRDQLFLAPDAPASELHLAALVSSQIGKSAAGNALAKAIKQHSFSEAARTRLRNEGAPAVQVEAARAYQAAVDSGCTEKQAAASANKAAKDAATKLVHATALSEARARALTTRVSIERLDARAASMLDAFDKGKVADAKRLAISLRDATNSRFFAVMDAEVASGRCSLTPVDIAGPPQQRMLRFEFPDGTVVRYKPLGDFMRRPSFSIEVKKDPLRPDSGPDDIAFKVDAHGVPVPKNPRDVDNPYPKGSAQAIEFIEALMDAGHRQVKETES